MQNLALTRDEVLGLLALVEDALHDLLSPRHHDLVMAFREASALLGHRLFPPDGEPRLLVGEMLRVPIAARRHDLSTLDLYRRIDAGAVPLHRNPGGAIVVAAADLPGDQLAQERPHPRPSAA